MFISTEIVFQELSNPERITPYKELQDRYANIGSTSLPRTKRAIGRIEEYPTKGGYEINASKVVKLLMSTITQKFSIIATQCPTQDTIDSFWDLVISSKVDYIVALGPIDPEKLIEYWNPEKIDYHDAKYVINVRDRGIQNSAHCREIMISDKSGKNPNKIITHYHYERWPDYGLPSSPDDFEAFVNFFGDKGRKLVVHCSAGVGRTGTFAGCLCALRSHQRNPGKIVNDMRRYRSMMVQRSNQFDLLCKYVIRNCMSPSELEKKGLKKPDWDEKIDYNKNFS